MMLISRRCGCWLAGWVILAAGCDAPPADVSPTGEPSASQRAVLVFGAASTTDALGEACAAFTADTGIATTTSFASSAALAQQILHGAEAQVFLSANVQWVERIAEQGLVAERVDLLGNRLVVIAPADSALQLQSLAELPAASIRRLALADPAAVPAGIYARQTLEYHGVWSDLAARVVAGADVRQALAYVEQGAAEVGIVYATDAALSDGVRVVLKIDPPEQNPIVYPLVLLKSGHGSAAGALFAYLQSPAAFAIFQRYGFTVHAAEE
jgi:molybdate transport system substrate-binding protein